MAYKLSYSGAQIDNALQQIFAHVANKNNPHEVTAAQAGAVAKSGDTMTGNLAVPTISNLQGVNSSGAEVSFGGNLKINGTDQVITAANVSTYAVVPNQAAVSGMLAVNKFGDQPDGRIELIRWDGAAFLRNIKSDGTYREIVIQQDDQPLYNTASGTVRNVLLHTGNITQYAPQIVAGSYVGSGTYGSGNKSSIAFAFKPKFVIIAKSPNVNQSDATYTNGASGFTYQNASTHGIATVSWSGNTMQWYANSADNQYNRSGETYNYFAIG